MSAPSHRSESGQEIGAGHRSESGQGIGASHRSDESHRSGESHRNLVSLPDVAFPDGSHAAVDLVLSEVPAPEEEVFAALVFLRDRSGRFALVYSPRRQEWASPGGAREEGETVRHTVVREVLEETGLVLEPDALDPCGFQRFRPATPGHWPQQGGCLQVFRAHVDADAPPMRATEDDVTGWRWATFDEFEKLSGWAFWWPLAAALFSR